MSYPPPSPQPFIEWAILIALAIGMAYVMMGAAAQ